MAIYFDNSATTRPFGFVAARVYHYMLENYHNPSALYPPAVAVRGELERVRAGFAVDLGVREDEIFFTSGGTEANNGAVFGAAFALRGPMHLITTAVEHPSVRAAFEHLERLGHSISYLSPGPDGVVDVGALERAITPDTAFVSVMHVNNEVGSVMDIASMGAAIKRAAPRCVFHVDGVQAYPKVRADLADVDLYSISGHKFHAPRGTGVLMKKRHVRIAPLMFGGGQEGGLRAGTENTPGIMGLGEAQRYYVKNREGIVSNLFAVRDRLRENLLTIPDTTINGPGADDGAPHILSASFAGIRGETLVHALEQREIYIGTGSACSAHHRGPNHVLAAMGIDPALAAGTVRFSFGCMNTPKESDIVAREVERALTHLRRFQKR